MHLVKLAKDLGLNGIDVDFEEFCHVDMNRVIWDNNGLIEDIRAAAWESGVIPEDKKAEAWQKKFDSYNYDVLLQKFAKLSTLDGYGENNPSEGVGLFVMSYTVNKFVDIINKIDEAKKELGVKSLKISTAGPAVGSIPIVSPQYGDSRAGNTIETAQGEYGEVVILKV